VTALERPFLRRFAASRRRCGALGADAAWGAAAIALFAWFALSACGGSAVLDASRAVVQDFTPPDGQGDAVTSAERPGAIDHTVSGVGTLGCTPDGRFGAAQGGDVGDRVKQSNDKLAEEYKHDIEEAEKANKRCGGPRSGSDYDRQAGCDRAKLKNLETRVDISARRMSELSAFAKSKSHLEPNPYRHPGDITSQSHIEVSDMTAAEKDQYDRDYMAAFNKQQELGGELEKEQDKCERADADKEYDDCSQAQFDRRNALIGASRAKLASVERARDNAKRCADDAKKQAQGPASRPAIDPGMVIQTLPGIMGGARPRPPSRPSSPPPTHSHGN
jgi:hypothetical protein